MDNEEMKEIQYEAVPGFATVYQIIMGVATVYLAIVFIGSLW